jgi:hypothetical protein
VRPATAIDDPVTRYTVWPVPGLPSPIRAKAAPGAGYAVIREPGDPGPAIAGWIGPDGAATLAQAFMRVVRRVTPEHTPVLLISPCLPISPDGPPAITDRAFRRACLGRHQVTRGALPLAEDARPSAKPEFVSPLATNMAGGFGFALRRTRGPVMVCAAGPAAASWPVTSRVAAQLLSRPFCLDGAR